MGAIVEHHAFRLHLRDAAVDKVLLHLEVGNAVAEKPAGLGVLLEQMHLMAGARELLRAGEARWARADDGDLLASLDRGRLRPDPTILPGAVDDRAFDGLDGNRVVVDVERARGLAGPEEDGAGQI